VDRISMAEFQKLADSSRNSAQASIAQARSYCAGRLDEPPSSGTVRSCRSRPRSKRSSLACGVRDHWPNSPRRSNSTAFRAEHRARGPIHVSMGFRRLRCPGGRRTAFPCPSGFSISSAPVGRCREAGLTVALWAAEVTIHRRKARPPPQRRS